MKAKIPLLLLIAATIWFTPAAHAGDIEGIIQDAFKRPLEDVHVKIEETGATARSAEDGAFSFRDLDHGSYRLVASKEGFRTIHGHAVSVMGESAVEVALEMMPVFHEEVTVTGATKTEKRLEEVPVRVEVVGKEKIETMEAQTLADAVEFETGVRVENNCQNCNFGSIRLLGLEGPYTQILMNGQPLVSSLAQVYGIEHLPSRMIERIEVIKGGGSSIHGPGSVGGLVNVIQHRPSESGGALLLNFSDMDGARGHSLGGVLDWVSEDGIFGVSLFGQNDKRRPVFFDEDDYSEVGRLDLNMFGFRIHRGFLEGRSRLSLSYDHTYEDRRGGSDFNRPEHQARIAESIQTRRNVATLEWFDVPSSTFNYKFTASFADTKRDTYYGAGFDPNAYGLSKNPLTSFDLQFNNTLGDHTLTWGAGYFEDELTDIQPNYNRITEDRYTNAGFYIQDDWSIGRAWELLYGFRADKHSEVDDTVLSPRVALKWAPVPEFALRASVATGFRAPQVFDEDLHITQAGGEGQVIRNDSGLSEESSISYTLGAEWTPIVGHGIALVEANVFRTDLSDTFLVTETDDPLTPDFEFTRVNHGEAEVYGLEMNLGYALTGTFQVEAGYVWQKSRFGEAEPEFGTRDFFRTPKQYGVLTFKWEFPHETNLFLGMKYTGPMAVPHYAGYIPEDRLDRSPSFFTADLRLAKSFPLKRIPGAKVNFAVGCKNLTNDYQDDFDQGMDRDAGYVYGPRFPRTYYVSMSLEF